MGIYMHMHAHERRFMDVSSVAKAVDAGPMKILTLEKKVLELEDRRRELMFELQIAEANLLTSDNSIINGKNAEIRAAQLLQETAPERIQINEYEREIARTKSELTFEQNMFRANQAILAFFSSRPDLTKI
jgi:acetylglutamate kinase